MSKHTTSVTTHTFVRRAAFFGAATLMALAFWALNLAPVAFGDDETSTHSGSADIVITVQDDSSSDDSGSGDGNESGTGGDSGTDVGSGTETDDGTGSGDASGSSDSGTTGSTTGGTDPTDVSSGTNENSDGSESSSSGSSSGTTEGNGTTTSGNTNSSSTNNNTNSTSDDTNDANNSSGSDNSSDSDDDSDEATTTVAGDYDGNGTVTRADLQKVLTDARKLTSGTNSAAWSALQNAITAAEKVLSNPNATSSQIADAVVALQSAMKAVGDSGGGSTRGTTSNSSGSSSDDTSSGSSASGSSSGSGTTATGGKTPQTGDPVNPGVFAIIAIVAGGAALFALYRRTRNVPGVFSAFVALVCVSGLAAPMVGSASGADGVLGTHSQQDVLATAADDESTTIDPIKVTVTGSDGEYEGSTTFQIANEDEYYEFVSSLKFSAKDGYSLDSTAGGIDITVTPVDVSGDPIVAVDTLESPATPGSAANWYAPGTKSERENAITVEMTVKLAGSQYEAGKTYEVAKVDWELEPVVYDLMTVQEIDDPIVGEPIKAVVANAPTDGENTFTYTWQYKDGAEDEWQPITNGDASDDGKTYTPTADMEGKTIRVVVTCENPCFKTIKAPEPAVAKQTTAVPTYTVTFSSLGLTGAPDINPQTIAKDQKAIEPKEPTMEGYNFDGWFADAGCTDEWNFDTPITKDTTIYLGWSKIIVNEEYKVNHYLEKLAWTDESDKYELRTEDSETKSGQVGAQTEALAKTYEGFQAQEFTQEEIKDDGSTVVSIYYDRKSYTVTFDAKIEGTENVSRQVRYQATLAETDVPSFQDPDGKTFGGWFNDEALTNEFDFASTPITEDTTLYAKWEEAAVATYTVTFNANGGSEVESASVEAGSKAEKPADPAREGYTFGGWFIDEDLTTAFDFASTPIMGYTTLYAKWEEAAVATYTVTFNANGGSEVEPKSVEAGSKAEKPADPTWEGYTFAGWFSDEGLTAAFDFASTPITGDTTLYAKWEEAAVVTYTVTFNANGGSEVESASVVAGSKVTKPEDPTRDGYTFEGWYSDQQLETSYDFDTPVTSPFELYAKWEPSFYAITYDYGMWGENLEGAVAKDSPSIASVPAATAMTGYVFTNWYSDAERTQEISFPYEISQDTTLYAKYSPITYTVKYESGDAGDGAGAMDPSEFTYNQEAQLAENTFTYAGYVFAGWRVKDVEEGSLYNDKQLVKNLASTQDAEVTLVAQWTPDESQGEEPGNQDVVRIDYTPVPQDKVALLVAVPPSSISEVGHFSYKWEHSIDEQSTWSEVDNSTSQLQVLTNVDNLNTYYRVTLIAENGSSQPSGAVKIEAGTGLAVQLGYVLPQQNNIVGFAASVLGVDESESSGIQYRWERSTDGCLTWTTIPEANSGIYGVEVNPATTDDPGQGDGTSSTGLVYIRVEVTIGSQTGFSAPLLLAKQTGGNGNDDSGSGESGDDNQNTDPENPGTDPENPGTDPEDPNTDPENQSEDPEDPNGDPENQNTDPENQNTDLEDPNAEPGEQGGETNEENPGTNGQNDSGNNQGENTEEQGSGGNEGAGEQNTEEENTPEQP